jgi:hypothetical protein
MPQGYNFFSELVKKEIKKEKSLVFLFQFLYQISNSNQQTDTVVATITPIIQ